MVHKAGKPERNHFLTILRHAINASIFPTALINQTSEDRTCEIEQLITPNLINEILLLSIIPTGKSILILLYQINYCNYERVYNVIKYQSSNARTEYPTLFVFHLLFRKLSNSPADPGGGV